MIKAVIFDMDGTLFDTERIYTDAWRAAARRLGIPEDEIVKMRSKFAGRNHASVTRLILEKFGEGFPVEEAFRLRDEYIWDLFTTRGVPRKPGVPEVLEQLKSDGIRMALASGTNPRSVGRMLELTDTRKYFEAVLTGADVTNCKPAPDVFLLTAGRLGLDPSECAVAEDSENGVRAANAAGMRVFMIPDLQPCTDGLRPLVTELLETLEPIPAILRRWNAEG